MDSDATSPSTETTTSSSSTDARTPSSSEHVEPTTPSSSSASPFSEHRCATVAAVRHLYGPGSEGMSDGHVWRFYVGSGAGTVEAGVAFLRQHEVWRRALPANLGPAAFPNFSPRLWRFGGTTLSGNVVLIATSRLFVPNEVPTLEEFTCYVAWHMDLAVSRLADADRGKLSLLVDLRGLGLRNMSIDAVKHPCLTLLRHYPERLGTCYLIGAPFVFRAFWTLLEKLLDDRTRGKVVLLPGDSAAVAAALDGIIPPERLERQFGGSADEYPPIYAVAAAAAGGAGGAGESTPPTPTRRGLAVCGCGGAAGGR